MAYGEQIHQVLYGGDYNPEQWPQEVWPQDIRLMKQAHISVVTLNVFSWAALQPEEGRYSFHRLDKIMELMGDNGLKVYMGTGTAAHPAWMAKRYPDVLRTDFQGRKRKFGGRHNSCPNSPTYRQYAPRLAGKLAQRYAGHDSIVAWHVSNEFGGECYCENCERAFRQWLRERYGTLDEVNRVYNTAFWGHTFYDWDEIVLPNLLSEHFEQEGKDRTMFQGISLDYRRFNSDSLLACYELEAQAIRAFASHTPITTNLMGFYYPLDYRKWAKSMDFISWDAYPAPGDSPAQSALPHDLMRGLKGQRPFVLMEQTPSVTNWQPYNRLKRPGVMRLLSLQAAAHGADAIQFFQMRQSVGACEKLHGAVIDHAGRGDTRVFREVAALGEELRALGPAFLGGRTPARAALIFDWENWWAIDYSAGPSMYLNYLDALLDYYQPLFGANIPVDIIGMEDDLSAYKIIFAPVLAMMKNGVDERIRNYVQGGGHFVSTYFSGIIDEHDLLVPDSFPGPLADILGLWVEESDALPPKEENAFSYDGACYPARLICDLFHLEGAEAIGLYQRDFYAGRPVISRNRFGTGLAYYVGCRSDKAFYAAFVRDVTTRAGVSPVMDTPAGVEATIRETAEHRVLFLLNHAEQAAEISLKGEWYDFLRGMALPTDGGIVLEGRDCIVLGENLREGASNGVR